MKLIVLICFLDDSLRLLNKDQLRRLGSREVTEDLRIDSDLIGAMLSAGCITRRQSERFTDPVFSNMNAILLDMMRRKSFAEFKNFLKCLEKTHQQHVANCLTKDKSTYINVKYLRRYIYGKFPIRPPKLHCDGSRISNTHFEVISALF